MCVQKEDEQGLLVQYQSHVDSGYKRSLLRTMLDRAKCLSPTSNVFFQECNNLKKIFLKYREKLIDSTFHNFQQSPHPRQSPSDIRLKIRNLLTWFADDFATSEERSTKIYKQKDHGRAKHYGIDLVNQQNVVYEFKCDLCDPNYFYFIYFISFAIMIKKKGRTEKKTTYNQCINVGRDIATAEEPITADPEIKCV